MKAIGIDIGTTTISTVVLDQESRQVLRSETISNGSFIRTENSWERIQDPDVILPKARNVLDKFLTEFPDTASIGITGQMHGIVYMDASGHALSPLYTWQDGRGEAILDIIRDKTGKTVASGYGLVTHIYNLMHDLVPTGTAKLGTIGDYLGMQLCGLTEPLIHISNAASLGFFDSRRCCFDQDSLLKMGVDPSILPEITDEFTKLGEYRGIPVTAAIGDNQASFLGSVGLQENVLLLNMGTGGQISVLSNHFFEAPGIEARPLVRGKYLLVGSSLCGGRAYAILENFLRAYVKAACGEDASQYQVMAELAAKGAGADPMRVDTRFNGSRTDPALRGSITNLSEDNFTPEGLIYGILYGMSKELFDLYAQIREGTGIVARLLIASGNGYRRNPILRQISGEMFGAKLIPAPYEEEAACGAAISSF